MGVGGSVESVQYDVCDCAPAGEWSGAHALKIVQEFKELHELAVYFDDTYMLESVLWQSPKLLLLQK